VLAGLAAVGAVALLVMWWLRARGATWRTIAVLGLLAALLNPTAVFEQRQPLVYWPLAPQGPRVSYPAIQRINAYLKNGGTIVFDTREGEGSQNGPAALRLREILRQLNLAQLAPIPENHVLTKAFYLLSEFPGRWTGSPVWVELGDDRVNDGVSSVIIGANDWAAAWALDQNGRPMFAAVPGGEAQRETAIRFGVNLVMYALAGNYKADQVHVEAILDRLRR
jgi:hypothetical protein